MARVDDKARFYLERAVPQLREFETHDIFTKDEIRTLVRKRTDFEHLILSPRSKPADFLAYIDWEQSLESLRAKRCARLRIKQVSSRNACIARIFKTYDRAVTRHPGSGLLWQRYLAFADSTKATKRWWRIMTRALRFMPSEGALWVMASQRAVQDGDMDGARGLLMRGCRFCTSDATVWIEYARVEMNWLAKLAKRKPGKAKMLPEAPAYDAGNIAMLMSEEGKPKGTDSSVYDDGDGFMLDAESDDGDFSTSADLAKAISDAATEAAITMDTTKLGLPALDDEAVRMLTMSPVLGGAIPRAIVDAAQKQPFFGPEAGEAFFNLFSLYALSVPAQPGLIEHVITVLDKGYPRAAATWNCHVKRHLLARSPEETEFPRMLRMALTTLRDGMAKTDNKAELAKKSVFWIDKLLRREDMDIGLRAVLEDMKRKLEHGRA